MQRRYLVGSALAHVVDRLEALVYAVVVGGGDAFVIDVVVVVAAAAVAAADVAS